METYTIAIRTKGKVITNDIIEGYSIKDVYRFALGVAKQMSRYGIDCMVSIHVGFDATRYATEIYSFKVDCSDSRFHNIEFARVKKGSPFVVTVINDRVRR